MVARVSSLVAPRSSVSLGKRPLGGGILES